MVLGRWSRQHGPATATDDDKLTRRSLVHYGFAARPDATPTGVHRLGPASPAKRDDQDADYNERYRGRLADE